MQGERLLSNPGAVNSQIRTNHSQNWTFPMPDCAVFNVFRTTETNGMAGYTKKLNLSCTRKELVITKKINDH